MLAFFSRSSATNRSLPRGLRVVDDLAQLGEVRGPQVVRDVVHRLRGQQPQRLGLDLQEGPAVGLERCDTPSVVTSRYGVSSAPGGEQVGVAEVVVGTHAEATSRRADNGASRG